MKNNIFRNKKTGNLYRLLFTSTNCTNKDDGKLMIIYTDDTRIFVREAEEFFEKFERVKDSQKIISQLEFEKTQLRAKIDEINKKLPTWKKIRLDE